jgi:hypothetical protein
MGVATTDVEANYIFDLLADRDDRTAVSNYARWLEDRDPLRAEFLRLMLSHGKNEAQLEAIRKQLDPRWFRIVMGRWIGCGDVVRITAGVCKGMDGTVVELDAAKGLAGLFLRIFCRQSKPLWVPFGDLRVFG